MPSHAGGERGKEGGSARERAAEGRTRTEEDAPAVAGFMKTVWKNVLWILLEKKGSVPFVCAFFVCYKAALYLCILKFCAYAMCMLVCGMYVLCKDSVAPIFREKLCATFPGILVLPSRSH